MFQTYQNLNVVKVFTKILNRKISKFEGKFFTRCLWVVWIWTLLQLIECILQLIWWVKLLKIVDYERKLKSNGGSRSMINEDEDGMIFTRNSLNPSKFDYQHGKKKSELLEDSNSLFGDSDTSEENFSYTTNRLHHMKEDLGELNNLETTLDFISHRLT